MHSQGCQKVPSGWPMSMVLISTTWTVAEFFTVPNRVRLGLGVVLQSLSTTTILDHEETPQNMYPGAYFGPTQHWTNKIIWQLPDIVT